MGGVQSQSALQACLLQQPRLVRSRSCFPTTTAERPECPSCLGDMDQTCPSCYDRPAYFNSQGWSKAAVAFQLRPLRDPSVPAAWGTWIKHAPSYVMKC